MSVGHGPTVTRRRLRTELRRLREETGLAQEFVVNRMEWSLSKLIRIESGSVGISINDLRALLDLYRVDQSVRDDLLDLARAARQRMWWSRYQKHMSPTYLEFVGYEADATAIKHFQPMIVPGLLQTEAYARAINSSTSLRSGTDELDGPRTEIRLQRQRGVLERPDPVHLVAVIDEAVLHRPVGGAETMAQQLDHLIELAERPNISIVVIPYAVGAHPGLTGAFSIMEFADPIDDDVLFIVVDSGVNEMILRDQPGAVERYRQVFDQLIKLGVTDEAAINLITRVRHELI